MNDLIAEHYKNIFPLTYQRMKNGHELIRVKGCVLPGYNEQTLDVLVKEIGVVIHDPKNVPPILLDALYNLFQKISICAARETSQGGNYDGECTVN